MKMAKKKLKRVVRNKSSKSKPARTKANYAFWLFVNALLIAVFIYGCYRMWKYSWAEGLSIIVFDLLVILIIKLILKLRQK